MAKQRTTYDPLACIPSVRIIEQRLRDAERETRRLRVLLKTAKAIEAEGTSKPTQLEGSLHA